MDGDSTNILAHHFAFPSMQAGANFDSQRFHMCPNGAGTPDSAGRAVECGQKAITCVVDFPATELGQFASYDGIVLLKEVSPCAVP